MEWLIARWGAFADWAAGQPVLFQIVIGSLVLFTAYLVFVLALSWLSSWVKQPIVFPPARPTNPGSPPGRDYRSRALPRGQQSRSGT